MFSVIFLLFILVGTYVYKTHGCERACLLNGAKADYILGNGCYCVPPEGPAYNPADSRGDR
jgi:hypothetical protein